MSGRGAFTLVEVLIATFLSAIAILGVMTTYVLLIRNGLNLQAYAEMETQVRRAFDQFGLDARMASGLSTGTNSVTLTVPNNYTSTNNEVTYGYDTTNQVFYLVPGDGVSSGQTYVAPGSGAAPTGQRILIGQAGTSTTSTKVTSFTFTRYTAANPPATTTDDSSTKHVQISLNVRRSAAAGNTANESAVSASFTLRNKT